MKDANGDPWEVCALCRYLTDSTRQWALTGEEYCYLDEQIVLPSQGHCAAYEEDDWMPNEPTLALSAHEKAALLARKGDTYHELAASA